MSSVERKHQRNVTRRWCPDGSGEIGYQGTVALPGEVQWIIRYSLAAERLPS
ncbi:MAG: hypothetical protein ACRDT0_14050 [Pseudonocardiaceae bacterium]